jgi:glucans biosynthesis protein C
MRGPPGGSSVIAMNTTAIEVHELHKSDERRPGLRRLTCGLGRGEIFAPRLPYLDNLRVLLVVGVIAVHSAVTYGFDGSWYLESYDELASGLVDALTVVIVIGWLFGLGLFFLIAGRLSGPSLDRKGPARFARERLIRLGAPVLAYTLIVSPALEYVAYRENDAGTEGFWPFFSDRVWQLGPGPTWFLEALLAFSLGYALLRMLRPPRRPSSRAPLRGRAVAVIALAIAVTSFAAHLVFPIGSEQFHLQLGMFPQYLILFSLGVAAGRRGWLETLTPELRRRCGLAAAMTALAMPAILVAGDYFAGGAAEDRFAGGWHWQAAAASLTEGLLATCVSLWAIGYFHRRHNHLRPRARQMAPVAYGAFVIHAPLIVGLALAIQGMPVPAELKFACVLTGGIAGSFTLARLARRLRPIDRILGTGRRAVVDLRSPVRSLEARA